VVGGRFPRPCDPPPVVEAARRHAMAVVRELLRNEPPHAFVGWHISVVDEQGVVVFKVTL
jgi:hypothetical protein